MSFLCHLRKSDGKGIIMPILSVVHIQFKYLCSEETWGGAVFALCMFLLW